MQFFAILNELWRRRIAVGIALLVSIIVGMSVAYQIKPGLPPTFKSRQHLVGVASARVLVNTPSSIVADLNPNGGGSLATHAQLLGNLLSSDQVRSAVAKSAGIPLASLVVEPLSVGGVIQTPLATTTPMPVGASTLSVNADPLLPLITINAQAPDARRAAALANAAVSALQSYIESVAAAQNIPTSHRPVVTSLGPAQGINSAQGPLAIYGVLAMIVLFGLSCYLILVVTGARRRLRELRLSRDGAPSLAPELADQDAAADQIPADQIPARHPAGARRPATHVVHGPALRLEDDLSLATVAADYFYSASDRGGPSKLDGIAHEPVRADGPRPEHTGPHSHLAGASASSTTLSSRFRRD